jgi:hypothetical protein
MRRKLSVIVRISEYLTRAYAKQKGETIITSNDS